MDMFSQLSFKNGPIWFSVDFHFLPGRWKSLPLTTAPSVWRSRGGCCGCQSLSRGWAPGAGDKMISASWFQGCIMCQWSTQTHPRKFLSSKWAFRSQPMGSCPSTSSFPMKLPHLTLRWGRRDLSHWSCQNKDFLKSCCDPFILAWYYQIHSISEVFAVIVSHWNEMKMMATLCGSCETTLIYLG